MLLQDSLDHLAVHSHTPVVVLHLPTLAQLLSVQSPEGDTVGVDDDDDDDDGDDDDDDDDDDDAVVGDSGSGEVACCV